jgi:hypothetical protein
LNSVSVQKLPFVQAFVYFLFVLVYEQRMSVKSFDVTQPAVVLEQVKLSQHCSYFFIFLGKLPQRFK